MNKTIIININSIVFHIEEDAYEQLRAYMIDIKRHFGNSDESKEILEDIENRIAEMFAERIKSGRKEVINQEDVQQVTTQMGRVSDFDLDDTADAETIPPTSAFEEPMDTPTLTPVKKLMRDPEDTMLGGVCSGIAHYFGLEPKWIRLVFALMFLVGGTGIFLYIVLWIAMPLAETRADKMAMRGEAPNLQNFKKSFDEEIKGFSDNFSGAGERLSKSATTAGSFLSGCFSVFAKMFSWLFLIFAAMTLFGLSIFYVFNMLNLIGFENPMYFPPLDLLTTTQAQVAITMGYFAVAIPFVILFFLLLKVIFKTNPLTNFSLTAMIAIWFVSIIGIIYFSVSSAQSFREKSTVDVQRDLVPQAVYIFDERDIRVVDANEKDSLTSLFDLNLDGHDLHKHMHTNFYVYFESLDSLSKPYIKYSYSAKAENYRLASERARNISFEAVQIRERIIFPSHFITKPQDLIRDQSVQAKVFLPVGAKVIIYKALDGVLGDLPYYACLSAYGTDAKQKYTEWTMTTAGLVCSQKKSSVEEETKSSDKEVNLSDAIEKELALLDDSLKQEILALEQQKLSAHAQVNQLLSKIQDSQEYSAQEIRLALQEVLRAKSLASQHSE